MPELPFQIERYIVKQLACDEEPDTIAEDVKGKFLRTLDPDDVLHYCPEANGEALTPDLRDLYQVTRWEYRGVLDDEEDDRSFVSVATTDEVGPDTIHCVEREEGTVLLVEHDGEYRALGGRCTHQGGALCDGDLGEGTVECPLHGAAFDLDTGEPVNPPATEAVDTFDVRVEGDAIEVRL